MCPPGYQHNCFVATHALEHKMCMSCKRVTGGDNREGTLFLMITYIYIYIYNFALRGAHQRYMLMNRKHHKSDTYQVAIQLVMLTTRGKYMRTQAGSECQTSKC